MSHTETTQEQNMFDKLPDETIARIFTLGNEELDCPVFSNAIARWLPGRTPGNLSGRRPYPFTICVMTVCRRFFFIVHERSNAHLFYVSACIWQGYSLPGILQFHHALEISHGCDMHLSMELNFPYQHTEIEWRLSLHALKRAEKYFRQFATIEVTIPSPQPRSLLLWISKWFGRVCSSPRLSLARIRLGLEKEGAEFEGHLYDDCTPSPEVLFLAPHLSTIRLGGLPVGCAPKLSDAHCLTSLTLLRNPNPPSQPHHNWPLVANLLPACPTLRTLEAVITNGKTPVNGCPRLPSHLVELSVVIDPSSLSALFQTFNFPDLERAIILVVSGSDAAKPSDQLLDGISLPSLSHLAFLDSTRVELSFLDQCEAPVLNDLTIRTCVRWTPGLQFRLHSPKTLTVGLGTALSITDQLAPLDLLETEVLRIVSPELSFEAILDQCGRSAAESRIKVPQLHLVTIRGSHSLLNIIRWLESLFELPPQLNVKFENSHIKAGIITRGHKHDFPQALVTSLSFPPSVNITTFGIFAQDDSLETGCSGRRPQGLCHSLCSLPA